MKLDVSDDRITSLALSKNYFVFSFFKHFLLLWYLSYIQLLKSFISSYLSLWSSGSIYTLRLLRRLN